MKSLQILGAVIGIIGYIPISIGIIKGKVKQNYVTWALWAMLDALTAAALIQQGGNSALSVGYAIGSLVVTAILLLMNKEKFTISRFDRFIVFLVIACTVTWQTVGNIAGIVAGTTALVLASIPQIIDTAKHPEHTPILPYTFFGVAALISFVGGTGWAIEQKLFPGTALILCFILVILASQKTKVSQTGLQQ